MSWPETLTDSGELGTVRHVDVLSKTHEGTFGGAVVRDRLWFFTAGRYETANTPNTAPYDCISSS